MEFLARYMTDPDVRALVMEKDDDDPHEVTVSIWFGVAGVSVIGGVEDVDGVDAYIVTYRATPERASVPDHFQLAADVVDTIERARSAS